MHEAVLAAASEVKPENVSHGGISVGQGWEIFQLENI
jgi:hypothetical protein